MNLREYQNWTPTVAVYPGEGSGNMNALCYCGLKLAGEAGEVAEKIGKHIRGDGDLDVDSMEKELGDVMWYVSQLCNELGLDMRGVLDTNVEKLESRKERGKLQGSGDDR